MARKWMTGKQVLARMRRGDMPALGCWDVAARFDDGAIVSTRVLRQLLKWGGVIRPPTLGIHSRYRLAARLQHGDWESPQ